MFEHWQFSSNMFNIRSSKKSNSYSPSLSSSSCYLARTLNTKHGQNLHPSTWSMSSTLTTLPESPFCNHLLPPPPSHATTYIVDNATGDFSTPRNQRLSMAYDENNNNSNCFSEIDEWLEHANKFCKSFNHDIDDRFTETRGNGSADEQDMRMSAVCNNYLAAQEHQLYNIILPSVREESPVPQNITSCINRYGGEGSGNQHTKLINRPKPYDEFLNETRKKKLEADIDARNKAKHLHLMHRLRRKEEAINDWELHQTMKAMDQMDKIQNELERKQVMASVKTQDKIFSVRDKAEKQKLKLRRSTMKKFQQLQIQETRSPSDSSWDSRLHFCSIH